MMMWLASAHAYWLVAWQSVRQDTQEALCAGVVLGVIIVVVLSLFPGEPFDYAFEDGNVDKLRVTAGAPPPGDDGVSPPLRNIRVAERAALGAAAAADAAKDEAKDDKAADGASEEPVASSSEAAKKTKLVIDERVLDAKSRKAEKVLGIPRAIFKSAVLAATEESAAASPSL